MDTARWKTFYEQICLDLDLDPEMDRQATEYLSMLTEERELTSPEKLDDIIRGKRVRIFGRGPTLADDIKKGGFDEDVILAADGATSDLLEADIQPHIIVTDLDGGVEDQVKANADGALVVLHAHGDNMDLLKTWVPKFTGDIILTTQTDPTERIHNFGGFTDGDRGAYLADHFGADSISLVAFNFLDPTRKRKRRPAGEGEAEPEAEEEDDAEAERKFRKLTWANVLIGMLDHPHISFFDLE